MKELLLVFGLLNIASVYGQNVGIGTNAPTARLHVKDSAVLFEGDTTIPANTPFAPPASGRGARMFWYPQKAAFRVGIVEGDQWDKDNIGRFSFASGWNAKAIGQGAVAFGSNCYSEGSGSFSAGENTTITGSCSFSFGSANEVSGPYSGAFALS